MAKKIRYIGCVVLSLLVLGATAGCGRLYTREFLIPESQASPDLNGWALDIDLEHYRMMSKGQVEARPKSWYFHFSANHPRVQEGARLFDLNVDSIHVLIPDADDTIKMTIGGAFFLAWSPLNDPITKGFVVKSRSHVLWIPDEIDSVDIEFFCKQQPGVLERFVREDEIHYEIEADTIVWEDANKAPIARKVTVRMVRHETDVWFPF